MVEEIRYTPICPVDGVRVESGSQYGERMT